MFDLIIRGALVVDPLNKINAIKDVAVAEGKITAIEDEISLPAKKLIEASGKVLIPGIIDMHTHMRTVLGHKHAQRMIALAGVCTTLDMAGPLEDILTSIPGSGAGVNIAILDAARAGQTLTSSRPSQQEQSDFLDRTLENGGIGVKLLGGHFPMDVDISENFIELANQKKSWIAWHVGSTAHGSNIEGFREAVAAAKDNFLHIAHINSYCRGQISNETDEALELLGRLFRIEIFVVIGPYSSDRKIQPIACHLLVNRGDFSSQDSSEYLLRILSFSIERNSSGRTERCSYQQSYRYMPQEAGL